MDSATRPVAAEESAAEPTAGGVGRVRCARCRADLWRVPAAARFCPRCGAVLGAEAAPPDATDLLRKIHHVDLHHPGQRPHSAMIDGYASALYHLGQRYEGSGRHDSAEAVRCYLKAARLGNLPALGRLAAVCLEKERGRDPAPAEGAPEDGQKAPA